MTEKAKKLLRLALNEREKQLRMREQSRGIKKSTLRGIFRSNFKCGACGKVGHIRTNQSCALYKGKKVIAKSKKRLANINRRKSIIKMSKSTITKKRFDNVPRKSRSKVDQRNNVPITVLSKVFKEILTELKDVPDVLPFMHPVNAKFVPDYYEIIARPMDLQTIETNVKHNKYENRKDFLADVKQIVKNSSFYNGPKSQFTMAAQKLLDKCLDCLAKRKDKFIQLEKELNPFSNIDEQVAAGTSYLSEIDSKVPIAQSLSDMKRKRGRPRKRAPTDDVGCVKRSRRGRPKKKVSNSDLENPNESTQKVEDAEYEEDGQSSTDEDEFEKIMKADENVALVLSQCKLLNSPTNNITEDINVQSEEPVNVTDIQQQIIN